MKKIILLFIGFIFVYNYSFARYMSPDTAKIVAINYYKANTGISNTSAFLYYTKIESDSIIDFYIFNIIFI